MTALVLCAHGTRDAAGRDVIRGVVEAVAAALPEVAVHEAYVDVHGPEVGEVVAAVSPVDGPCADGPGAEVHGVEESHEGGPGTDELGSDEVGADGPRCAGVVVPLLLAAGFHVHVDLADAVHARPDV
ncbi:MAG: sirohydrochlorin chelatase, partial [Dermatophilaceae bacterium]